MYFWVCPKCVLEWPVEHSYEFSYCLLWLPPKPLSCLCTHPYSSVWSKNKSNIWKNTVLFEEPRDLLKPLWLAIGWWLSFLGWHLDSGRVVLAGCCSHLHRLLCHPRCNVLDGLRSAEMAGVILTTLMFALQMLSEMVPGSVLLEVCTGYWKK